MTAIEEWASTVAAALAKEPEHTQECQQNTDMAAPCNCGYHPSTLDQRIAIGLLEARAVECRYWGNKMLERFIGRSDLPALVVKFAVFLSKKFFERETKLGKVGLQMCSVWPPNTPAETLVVDKEWDIQ